MRARRCCTYAEDIAQVERKAAEAEGRADRATETIFTRGLRPLGFRQNAPTSESGGLCCTVSEREFVLLNPSPVVRTRFVSLLYVERDLQYGSEASLSRYIVDVLEDVLHGLGLGNVFVDVEETLWMEASRRKQCKRPNSWVLYRRMSDTIACPCGAQETTLPPSAKAVDMGKDPLTDGKCLGQLYDYMMVLRHMFGVRYTYGIISTYAGWRVLWLEDADEPAQAADVGECGSGEISVGARLEEWLGSCGIPQDSGGPVVAAADGDAPLPVFGEDRRCYATRVFAWNDAGLVPLLASVVKKMAQSPIEARPFLCGSRAYECMSCDNVRWVARPFSQVDLGAFGGDADDLYVLEVFRSGGGDGIACLAADASGACCVVKFVHGHFDEDEAREACEAEAAAWRDVWGLKAAARILKQRWTVVMPYVRAFSDSEDAEACGVGVDEVSKALRRIADSGYVHTDMSWWHIGAMRRDSSVVVVGIDLAPMRFRRTDDPDAAFADMMRALDLPVVERETRDRWCKSGSTRRCTPSEDS